MLLGLGEVEPVDRRTSIWRVRLAFLNTITEYAPAALKDLAGLPYESFVYTGIEYSELLELANLWPAQSAPYFRLRSGASIIGLRNAIIAWSEQWNLNAPWCIQAALLTLGDWQRNPILRERLLCTIAGLNFLTVNSGSLPRPPRCFRLPHWDATSTSLAEYLGVAEKQLMETRTECPYLTPSQWQAIKLAHDGAAFAYCDAVLAVYLNAKDASGNPTWKRTEQRKEIVRNLRWAVEAQVLGKALLDIAAGYEDNRHDVSTVSRGIDDVLRLIELPKNPAISRGRPHKSDS